MIRVAGITKSRWQAYISLLRGPNSVNMPGWKARWTETHQASLWAMKPISMRLRSLLRWTCTALVVNHAGLKADACVHLPRLNVVLVRFEMLGGPDRPSMGIVQQRMMNFESSLPSLGGLLLHLPSMISIHVHLKVFTPWPSSPLASPSMQPLLRQLWGEDPSTCP